MKKKRLKITAPLPTLPARYRAATLALGLLGMALGNCDSRPAQPAAVALTRPDSLRLQGFLRWYLAFAERRDTSLAPLLRYALPPAGAERRAFLAQTVPADISTTGYIVLNERKAANYFDRLQASGYFSAGFLRRQAASPRQRAAVLHQERQTENGAVPGFEADEVFNTQDLYGAAEISQLRPAATPAVYQLPVGIESFYFYTRREQGQVVIDSIDLR